MTESKVTEIEIEDEKTLGLRFPLARIKKIMKTDNDVQITSQEAVVLIAKATELFVESLIKEAYNNTLQQKKKIVARRDVDACIESIDALAFLDGGMWSYQVLFA